MIDVHCHFDMAKAPERYISANEKKRIVTIGMTNLPSHFEMGYHHVKNYKYIRLALGLHPLLAKNHSMEYSKFTKLINYTSYIGEVGLDFSKEGYSTKEIQLKSFEFVLENIQNKKKIVSLHSRRAESDTLNLLMKYNINNAIFHWYSGSVDVLKKIIDGGFYLSINSAMINSSNGKKIISEIPKHLVLTETDYPYIKSSNINNVQDYLANLWNTTAKEVEKTIGSNFKYLINKIK